jgi:hypothetical protein
VGLAKDSRRYPDSIFQTDWTTSGTYADIDRELIRLLYHPEMQAGLERRSAQSLLAQILLSEK